MGEDVPIADINVNVAEEIPLKAESTQIYLQNHIRTKTEEYPKEETNLRYE